MAEIRTWRDMNTELIGWFLLGLLIWLIAAILIMGVF
ncbi:hypothetical protein [Bacteriophage sp.]|nr:hypothetical protein [Bacteriophage sp.]